MVLEIGSGTGRNLIQAARQYAHAKFFGIDVSTEMLTSAITAISCPVWSCGDSAGPARASAVVLYPAASQAFRAALFASSREISASPSRNTSATRRNGSASQEPEETVPPWRALVHGRWTLVDAFESDGKQFIVARQNQPPTFEIADLSARERHVLAFLALGQTNKHIAYELGISASTVGVLLHRAAQKLGCHSRAELLQRYRPQAAAPPGPPNPFAN